MATTQNFGKRLVSDHLEGTGKRVTYFLWVKYEYRLYHYLYTFRSRKESVSIC